MKTHPPDSLGTLAPVRVIEAIPVHGKAALDEETVRAEGIPTPAHLDVLPELGRGAMGRIHPATDRNLLRDVALKRLDKDLAREAFYRDGFVAEAQITGQLEHPNIVPVHELAIGREGVPYFTMKLVQGVTLARWLSSASRPPGSTERIEQGLEIFIKVCDAVAYAHYRGVIHRDLKPDNVMVGDFGQIYVMDWGLARLTKTRPASGEFAQMEAPGPVGTPDYMAPELARGNPDEMDERSDVFGLGAILYEIVSGRRPYGESKDQNALIGRACAGAVVPVDVACMDVGITRQLRDVVQRATAPDPARRYQTVQELQRDVQRFLRGGFYLPRKTFGAGRLIIREGDPGDAAYLIVSGSCRAFRQVGDRKEILSTMPAGSVFGEMALVLDEPRAASVEAITTTTVLVLDKRTIDEGLGVDSWAGAIVRALAERFRALEQQVRASGMVRGTGG
ncbi:MAG TPA: serine/threonine-protein kinase [Polyangiaceae bacterium]|nr:serine/threonine-protein kinase [Polyangiaceae bacterium]